MKFKVQYFLFFLSLLKAQAQEAPYYQAPQNREIVNNEIALPNLKTEKVYWYFSGNSGVKFSGKKLADDLGGEVTSATLLNTFWEAYLGINDNDKWQAEIGYIRNPVTLQWQLIDRRTENLIAPFGTSRLENTLALRFKKRLFTLDRVTKTTRLNLITGLHYTPNRVTEDITDFNFARPTLLSRQGFEDTIYVSGGFSQRAAPLSGELGLEVVGRLGNPLEIGFFVKYLISGRGVITSDIQIDSFLTEPRQTKIQLNGLDLMLGVSVKWNFLNGIRYLPDID